MRRRRMLPKRVRKKRNSHTVPHISILQSTIPYLDVDSWTRHLDWELEALVHLIL
jgi:hypothetical protein